MSEFDAILQAVDDGDFDVVITSAIDDGNRVNVRPLYDPAFDQEAIELRITELYPAKPGFIPDARTTSIRLDTSAAWEIAQVLQKWWDGSPNG